MAEQPNDGVVMASASSPILYDVEEVVDVEDSPYDDDENDDRGPAALVGSDIVTHHIRSSNDYDDDDDEASIVSTLSRSTLVVQAIPMAIVPNTTTQQQQMFFVCDTGEAVCSSVPPSATTRTVSWNSSTTPDPNNPTTAQSANTERVKQSPHSKCRQRCQYGCIWLASILAVLAVVVPVLLLDKLEFTYTDSDASASSTDASDPWRTTSLTPSLSPSEYPTLSPATPLQTADAIPLDFSFDPVHVPLTDTAIAQWHTLLASGLAAAWTPRQFGNGIVLDHVEALPYDSNTTATVAVTIHYYGNYYPDTDTPWPQWVYTTVDQQTEALLRQLQLLNPEFQGVRGWSVRVPHKYRVYDDNDSGAVATSRHLLGMVLAAGLIVVW